MKGGPVHCVCPAGHRVHYTTVSGVVMYYCPTCKAYVLPDAAREKK